MGLILDKFQELMETGHGVRMGVILESTDGEFWTVIDQLDTVRFDPEGRERDCQLRDLNFEDIVFHLRLRND